MLGRSRLASSNMRNKRNSNRSSNRSGNRSINRSSKVGGGGRVVTGVVNNIITMDISMAHDL